MNPTVIIRPPRPRALFPYWLGTVFELNRMQVHRLGSFEIPVMRVHRAGINREEIAELVCESWPEPRKV